MSILRQFLKVILTKCCTVEQKRTQFLKTHVNSSKKQARAHKNHPKPLKTNANNSKNNAKGSGRTPGYSHPGGPAIGTSLVMRPRSFASPARTARTTRTKRKRRRNEADLPVTGGRINRSNSPKPPILRPPNGCAFLASGFYAGSSF